MVTRTRTRRTTMSRSEAGRKGALARWGKISRTSSARTSSRTGRRTTTASRSRASTRTASRGTSRSNRNTNLNFAGSRRPTFASQRQSNRSTSVRRSQQPSWNIFEEDYNYENPSWQKQARNTQRGYQREPVLSYWELEDERYQPSFNRASNRRNATSSRFTTTRRTTRSRTR